MRITFVMPFTAIEGGSRVVAIYAEKLALRGHEVLVVSCARRPFPLRRRVKTRVKQLLKGQLRVAPSPTLFDHVPHLHRRIPGAGPVRPRDVPDADVVVATWWKTAEWVRDMPAAKGAKVHLIQHDERVFYEDPAMQQQVARTWALPGFSRVVVAGWIGDIGRREFGADSVLINNAVDTELFNGEPRERNDPPVMGLMYHGRHFKGTDISLRAFELAKQRVPELRLKAFGPEREIPGMPLPPGTPLQVMPPQPEIAAFYRSCDAYLFGSRSEGFGLPILEAMACGTPVIGTPTGAAPEMIARGGGRLVKMEDPHSMADAIVEIATMPPETWRAMSDAARSTAHEHDWDHATDAFEAVLHEAAEGRTPGAAHSKKSVTPATTRS